MNNIVISNGALTVEVNPMGAEISSVRLGNTEFMWDGKKEIWAGRAPVLFPICGGVKDDKYTLSGKEYTLTKHGFAKLSEFLVEKKTATTLVMLLKSSEATKASFPFDFEFRVKFSLDGKKLNVEYATKNCSDNTMYFSVGAHEAYACPEGIEDYTIKFDKDVTLNASELLGNLVGDKTTAIIENSRELKLKKDYFKVDALVFKNVDFDTVSLCKNNSTKKITVKFPEHKYFLIWTKYNGDYICLEPWCGIPDSVHTDQKFETKEGIISLAPKSECKRAHQITFDE